MSLIQNQPRKSMDADLVDLVGQYLARHSQQSYVNMEHMVESIQGKTFRFARMKRVTFTAMVKRAYNRYVQMQTAADTTEQMEDLRVSPISSSSGVDPELLDKVSSDSDIEIVESPSKPNRPAATPKAATSTFNGNGEAASSTTMSPTKLATAVSLNATLEKSPAKPEEPSESQTSKKRGTKRKLGSNTRRNDEEDASPSVPGKKLRKTVFPVFHSDVSFKDFAGGEQVIEEICQLLLHLKHPEIYRTLGITPPRGFILHGPPGCGKSLLANAISGELKVPTLKLAATELISGISGESENNIRDLFQQALDLAPSIIFLDEIDSITPKRENAQREMERRIVAQLLSCIDELSKAEKGDSVFLIGATNRIETIDSALRRAGRFDREINIGIPNERSREQILKVICNNLKLEPDFDFKQLAKLTPGYVGADLHALIREATIHAVKEAISPIPIKDKSLMISEPDVLPSKLNPSDGDVSINMDATIVEEKTREDDPKENPGSTEVDDTSVSASKTSVVTDIGSSDVVAEVINLESASDAVMDVDPPVVTIDETSPGLSINTLNAAEASQSKPTCSSYETKPPSKWIHDTSPVSQQELENIFVKMKHFQKALKHVQPSSKREGFATVPDTTWDDIGALKEIRDELQVSILGPVKFTDAFKALGIPAAGVLLCGPPGCGKTLLAKAVANEAGINFISVKGPELLNMYVGESERAVRQCFARAKSSAPCVIFFDELDALCPRRSDADINSTSRVVNQLLTEMDGMEAREGVFIMAATNRPDIIDPAVLRPGRLDKILFVNLPSPEDRADILKTITKNGTKPKLDSDVDFNEIAADARCAHYTGADLAAVVREASIAAFRELVLQPGLLHGGQPALTDLKVSKRHFEIAVQKVAPSVSAKDLEKYEKMKSKYAQPSA